MSSIFQGEDFSLRVCQFKDINLQIDGIMDEIVWVNAEAIDQFIQSEPHEGSPSTERTVVRLISDFDNLYVGFQCSSPAVSQGFSQLSSRDNISGDRVAIYISGTGDNETGYLFCVNAAGVQSDAFISSDGRYADFAWDGVWHSAIHKDIDEWSAEIKIPFRTMRFSTFAEWKIGFARFNAGKNENSYWPPIKVQQGIRISNLGRLNCISPSHPGLNLEIYPIGLVKYDKIADRQYSANGGLDLYWAPRPYTRVDFTGNPDFAQIESDPDRINLSRYETFFAEKRPFFIEGSNKFETPIQLFYSRRIGKKLPDGQIVPIYSAGKFQSNFGRNELSLLGALCGKVIYTDWSGGDKIEPQSFYVVSRVKRGIAQNSAAGIFYGAKENSSSFNRLFSIDGIWRTPEMEWQNQIALSFNKGVKNGIGYKSSLNLGTRRFMINAFSERYDEYFSANEVGYIFYQGEQHQFVGGPIWYQKGMFQSLLIRGGGALFRIVGDPGYTKIIALNINPDFNQFGFFINIQHWHQYEMGEWNNRWYYGLWLWPNKDSKISIRPSFEYTSWSYNYLREYFGPNGAISINASYLIRSNIELAWEGNNILEWRPDKSFEESSWIHELWYRWSLTRDFHFRIYYSPNLKTNFHKINLLFSYNFAPKSWVYLALNEGIDNSTGRPESKDRIITLKVSKLLWW